MSGRHTRPFHSLRRRAALVAATVAAIAAASPTSEAGAADYSVHSCRVGESGPYVSMGAWTRVADMAPPIFRASCSSVSPTAALQLSGDYRRGEWIAFQFDEPAGTEMRYLRWRGRTVDTGHTGEITAQVSTGGLDE